MKNLTLVIPAKHEKYSLPEVLKELKSINLYVTNIKCFKLNETNTKSPKPSNKKYS